MRASRATIGGLMGLVALAGVGAAAIRAGSPAWAGAVFSALMAVLGVALLGTIFARGRLRAFWAGFLMFGGGYLVLVEIPPIAASVRPRLLSSILIERAWRWIHPEPEEFEYDLRLDGVRSWSGPMVRLENSQRDELRAELPDIFVVEGRSVSRANDLYSLLIRRPAALLGPDRQSFDRIGHGMTAILLALIGGLVASRLSS